MGIGDVLFNRAYAGGKARRTIEFITEICLGVLMKAVPSIHIFALNIQLKVLIGLAAVLIMAQPMSDFIEKLMGIMWQNLYGLLGMMGS